MTKQYPSQKNRLTIKVDRSVYRQFAEWCKAHDLVIQSTLDALMRMCIEGELEVRQKTEVKQK